MTMHKWRKSVMAIGVGLGLLLSATADPGRAVAAGKKAAAGKPIDLEGLAKALASKSKPAEIPGEALPAPPNQITYKQPQAIRLPGGRGVLQLHLGCEGKHCWPRVIHAVDEDGRLSVHGRSELPKIRMDATAFEFLPAGLLDVDKDGNEELLIRYIVTGPARQGGGSVWAEMLAIVNLSDLSLALVHELKSGGRAGVDDTCKHQLSVLPIDQDKKLDLRWVRTCECVDTSVCTPGPTPAEDFVSNSDRRFALQPPAPAAK